MFNRTKSPTKLDEAYDRALDYTNMYNPDEDEYAKTVDQLVKLNSIKATPSPNRVSADTLALVGANLAGIAAVLWHEQAHVIASKAFAMIQKAH